MDSAANGAFNGSSSSSSSSSNDTTGEQQQQQQQQHLGFENDSTYRGIIHSTNHTDNANGPPVTSMSVDTFTLPESASSSDHDNNITGNNQSQSKVAYSSHSHSNINMNINLNGYDKDAIETPATNNTNTVPLPAAASETSPPTADASNLHFPQYNMDAAQQIIQSLHLQSIANPNNHHHPPHSTTTHHSFNHDHDHDHDHDNDHDIDNDQVPSIPPPPRQSEQTAREQLIERERQARLERERARLKQQLALSRERDEEDEAFKDADIARINSDDSIANTSIRALELELELNIENVDIERRDIDIDHREHEIELGNIDMIMNIDIDDTNLDRNMELPLPLETNGHSHAHAQDGDGKSLACTVGDEGSEVDGDANDNIKGGIEDRPTSPPLGFTMERFLQDGIVDHDHSSPNDSHLHLQHIDGSVSDGVHGHQRVNITRSHGEDEMSSIQNMDAGVNNSQMSSPARIGIEVDIDVDADIDRYSQRDGNSNMGGGGSIDRDNMPRLAQLTEAEILEMAEIDYASVGNMPPRSVRDERHLPDLSGMSNVSFDHTQTTMQESDTSAGVLSLQTQSSTFSIEAENEAQEGDATQVSSISNVARLPMESFVSLSRIPTSRTSALANGNDASLLVGSDASDQKPAAIIGPNIHNLKDEADKWLDEDDTYRTRSYPDVAGFDKVEGKNTNDDSNVNRIISVPIDGTPNVLEIPQRGSIDDITNDEYIHTIVALGTDLNSSLESFNLPNRIIRPGMVKTNGVSKKSKGHRRAQTTPNIPSFVDDFDYCKYNDTIGNASNTNQIFGPGLEINVSPQGMVDNKRNFPAYGSIDPEEGQSLISTRRHSEERAPERGFNLDSMVDSVFSSVRSMSTADFQAEINDCDKYSSSSVFSRASSERLLPLIVTLLIELPVLFMISGGSDRLCALIGQKRYQLLMAFLPLSTALSGNCGLQASTLSTRAISHLHVTRENYSTWLLTEVQVSGILGLAIGTIIGVMAYQMSGFDVNFAVVMCVANALGVLTSGFIGTLAPLVFTFIFHRDAGKWGGLLATSFQDIIGCFVMVSFSFHALKFLGTSESDIQ